MNKYICSCGCEFKNVIQADRHKKIFSPSSDGMDYYTKHFITRKKWFAVVIELFFAIPWGIFFRLLGMLLVTGAIINHFDLNLSDKESILLGIGLGILLS